MSKQIKAADAYECVCHMCGKTAKVLPVIRSRNPQNHTDIVQLGWRRIECPWCGKTNVPASQLLEVPA